MIRVENGRLIRLVLGQHLDQMKGYGPRWSLCSAVKSTGLLRQRYIKCIHSQVGSASHLQQGDILKCFNVIQIFRYNRFNNQSRNQI